ncbi:hypothetical protein A5N15_08080 [Rothia kristinae]|uniref:Uncharacterized protein n=1 Tax=Rothia kristinae TaxID=37923 RepID=A0A657IU23_9MICC|nr:hypothetical protein A5N15_08080 [Rothia kristinae]
MAGTSMRAVALPVSTVTVAARSAPLSTVPSRRPSESASLATTMMLRTRMSPTLALTPSEAS